MGGWVDGWMTSNHGAGCWNGYQWQCFSLAWILFSKLWNSSYRGVNIIPCASVSTQDKWDTLFTKYSACKFAPRAHWKCVMCPALELFLFLLHWCWCRSSECPILLGQFGLNKTLIRENLSCCTVFLPQPLPARPRPRHLQVLCHAQGLHHVRVVPVEPLLTQLWLGQPRPGAPEPAPQCAQRGRGRREAVPGAGGEGSMQWRREGTAAALPQVWPELPTQVLEVKKPVQILPAQFVLGGGCLWSIEIIDLVVVSCD